MMRNIEKKYSLYFEELFDFYKAVDWITLDCNAKEKKVDDSSLDDFEMKNDLKLGLGIRVFLKCLGKREEQGEYYPIWPGFYFNLKRLHEMSDLDKEIGYSLEGGKKSWKEDFSDKMLLINSKYDKYNQKPVFLDYDGTAPAITCTFERCDDLFIYLVWIDSDEGIETEEIHNGVFFLWKVRRKIYLNTYYIIRKIKYSNWNKLSKVPWFNYYNEIFNQGYDDNSKFRDEFDSLNSRKGLEKNRFIGIDEYEAMFVRFLIEEKGMPQMPEIFDPYADIVTFREYLKDDNQMS